LPSDHLYLQYYPKEHYSIPVTGCTPSEIQEIMAMQGATRLPRLYHDFLEYAGISSGDMFIGLDITYYYLTSYSFIGSMRKGMIRSGLEPLEGDYFSFLNQQGHTFWYFPLNGNDDPPVYGYYEDDIDKIPPSKICD
jgi:hypothetical protein